MDATQVYAMALYEAACNDQEALCLQDELSRLTQIFSAVDDYVQWTNLYSEQVDHLLTPLVGTFSEKLLKFLRILAEDGILQYYASIYAAYELVLMEHDLFYLIEIIVAEPLSQAVKHAIIQFIEQRWGKHYSLTFAVDASLIAGVRMTVNNMVIDNSILHRLEQIKKGV